MSSGIFTYYRPVVVHQIFPTGWPGNGNGKRGGCMGAPKAMAPWMGPWKHLAGSSWVYRGRFSQTDEEDTTFSRSPVGGQQIIAGKRWRRFAVFNFTREWRDTQQAAGRMNHESGQT
jgi:hypothetical protein